MGWSDAFKDKREHWCMSRETDIKEHLRIMNEYRKSHAEKLMGCCIAMERDEVTGIERLIGGIQVSVHGQVGDLQFPECCRRDPHDGEGHVDWIGVHEDARGKGIGTALMIFSDDYARAHGCTFITLEVVRG